MTWGPMGANLHQSTADKQAQGDARTASLSRERAITLIAADQAQGFNRPLWVQLRHRGEVFCGLVVEVGPARTDTPEFVRADTEVGTVWVPSTSTRVCSHASDDRCHCTAGAAAGRACEPRGGAGRSPLGNTGVTL